MDYKILFLDIDGTILKPDHTYAESTKLAITKAQEQGIEIFLATGRPLHEIDDLAEELGIQSFIGYNGAFAVYQDEIIVNEPMNKNTVEQCIQTAEANNHEMVLYTRDKNYFTTLTSPVVTNFIETFQLKKNLTWEASKSDQILGITVMNLPPPEAALYELETTIFMSPVSVTGIGHCYDIIRTNVNKGFAVEKILNLLDISPEQAIAFGDGMNDKEMLQAAGESFAMGNAHQDLFDYAKNRTTSVSRDGIYNGLKKLGLNM